MATTIAYLIRLVLEGPKSALRHLTDRSLMRSIQKSGNSGRASDARTDDAKKNKAFALKKIENAQAVTARPDRK